MLEKEGGKKSGVDMPEVLCMLGACWVRVLGCVLPKSLLFIEVFETAALMSACQASGRRCPSFGKGGIGRRDMLEKEEGGC